MKNDEYYINKIVSDLKIYYNQNKEENSKVSAPFDANKKAMRIYSPKTIIKNSWLSGFGDVNKRLDKKLDTLLFSVDNNFFLFESFVLIQNRISIRYYKSNKKYYDEKNQNKYVFYENGQKREIDYVKHGLEVIDLHEFLNHELKYSVVKDGVINHFLFSFGDKSYYSQINYKEKYVCEIFDELILIFNSASQDKIEREKRIKLAEEEQEREKRIKLAEEELRLKEEKWLKEKQPTEDIQAQVKNTIDKNFLNDRNVLEIVSSENYIRLLKESQTKVIEIDRDYIQKFVKIGGYLKSTEKNIFNIFKRILNKGFTSNFLDLSEFIINGELLAESRCIQFVKEQTKLGLKDCFDLVRKNISLIEKDGGLVNTKLEFNIKNYKPILMDLNQYIISYESLVVSSFKMINSLNEDDMIAFYEMYEVFDKLGIFDTQWQKSMLEKLGDLTTSLDDVSKSLKNVNSTIKNGMDNLSENLLHISKELSSGFETISSDIQYQTDEISSGLDRLDSNV